MKKYQHQVFYKLTTGILILIVAGIGLYVTKQYIFKEKTVFSASDFGDSIDIFSNYSSWKKSSTKKTEDTLSQTLYVLARSTMYAPDSNSNQGYRSVTPQSLIDINGDGLVDIVYHYRERYDASPTGAYSRLYSAVLLNKGSLTYELSYKCVQDATGWYGDCAE